MSNGDDGMFAAVGCLALCFYLVWVGVIIWAIIKLVSWVTAQ
jgi:tetrahydromethanopterin S-methyltransferase subunit B